MSTELRPDPISFTESAVNKIRFLREKESAPDLRLRIYIVGGGCSGFQYGFAFDSQMSEDDQVFGSGAESVIVDPMSLQYLIGAKVDYLENLQGAQFVVRNPNAETTCGCGSSFSLKEEE